MSLSKRHSFIRLIPLAVTLILFTCQKQVFDNPHDATSAADPSSWAPPNLQAQVLAEFINFIDQVQRARMLLVQIMTEVV